MNAEASAESILPNEKRLPVKPHNYDAFARVKPAHVLHLAGASQPSALNFPSASLLSVVSSHFVVQPKCPLLTSHPPPKR